MISSQSPQPPPIARPLAPREVVVLLIDDQPIIGEAVRRMLAPESDIKYFYCSDPTLALAKAEEVKPTVILQDLVMPQIDGLTLVTQFRTYDKTRDIPMIVLSSKEDPKIKADGFAAGANDYLVKVPDRIELIARIRYHSNAYNTLLQRNEAFAALVKSQEALAAELAEASEYVKSLLPAPLAGEIESSWEFITSTSLGGDTFGYHWIDPEHLGIFLLDVCGHGVGAALLSVSAMNAIRGTTLPNTDFHNPSEVLTELNGVFEMEKHNNMFFTIWYGVYHRPTRTLKYASGGHPPALLLSQDPTGAPTIQRLATPGFIIGGMPGVPFPSDTCTIPKDARLYVYSDGVYEIARPEGGMLQIEDLEDLLKSPPPPGVPIVQHVRAVMQAAHGEPVFDDDFSMVEFIFH